MADVLPILESMGGPPDSKIVREGGFQPISDPGPVPESLIRDSKALSRSTSPPAVAKSSRGLGPEERRRFAKLIRRKPVNDILRALSKREASPRELARQLGTGIGQVSYPLNELRRLGVIELVRTEQHRGAVEHYYRARVEVLAPLLELMASRKHRERRRIVGR